MLSGVPVTSVVGALMSGAHAHVFLDALAALERAIGKGATPWVSYDTDDLDTAAAYRALLAELVQAADHDLDRL